LASGKNPVGGRQPEKTSIFSIFGLVAGGVRAPASAGLF
jgi:hypothetical protein